MYGLSRFYKHSLTSSVYFASFKCVVTKHFVKQHLLHPSNIKRKSNNLGNNAMYKNIMPTNFSQYENTTKFSHSQIIIIAIMILSEAFVKLWKYYILIDFDFAVNKHNIISTVKSSVGLRTSKHILSTYFFIFKCVILKVLNHNHQFNIKYYNKYHILKMSNKLKTLPKYE
ncbi:hypothetical protein AGLY_009664 [Aphis glycines]|uniref:Uncharacterized protein n=1 Tax=Aphis glycines TaxID=307491 RepID=A0A6G0TGV7_APHGL|nr:hypothetical protein AGLY_009664 [Aphis glycines]